MTPFWHILTTRYVVFYVIVGMAAGLFVGLFASLVSKIEVRCLIKDGLLGLFGSLAGLMGTMLTPWPRNTVTYRMNGVIETVTTNGYRHPERVAVVVAVVLPLLRELYRFKRSRIKSDA
jgi:membrane associated rhomboid family serine protease